MKTMQEKMATAVLAAMISMNFAVVCSADESSTTNRLNTATSASLSAFTMDAATATTYWSLGHVPRAGEHAYSEVNCYVIKSDEKLTFAGDSLTLAGSAVLQMNAWFNVGTLHLGAGTSVRSASSNSEVYGDTASGSGIGLTSAQVLSGDAIWIKGTDASPTLFAIAQNRRLVVASPLRGTGTVRAQTHTASGYLRGAIAFTANSSQFAGRFVVSSRGGSKATPDPSTGKILQFYMTAAGNVGGAMPEFTYNGFTVENDSLVNGRNELTFDELTRGILIEKRARFVMTTENNRLTFNAPVTYHGELVFGNDYPTATDAPTGPGGGDLVLGAGAMLFDALDQLVADRPGVAIEPVAADAEGVEDQRLLLVDDLGQVLVSDAQRRLLVRAQDGADTVGVAL